MPTMIMKLAQSQFTAPIISNLKTKGIDIDTADVEGMTPLAYAIRYTEYHAANRLLELGANPNQILNQDGLNVLMLAVTTGNKKIVALLIKHGADVDHQAKSGYTAESLAYYFGFKDIASLITSGAGI